MQLAQLRSRVAALEELLEVHESTSLQQATNLEQAREDADAARSELEELSRVGSVLASELNVERIVQTVTDAATSLTGAQFGAFFYNALDDEGAKLTLYTLSGAPREAFESFGHPRATPVFAPTFYATGIVRSDDIMRDERYGQMPPHHGMPPGHLPVRSYLAVPVVSRSSEVLGGLFFGHEDVGVFTERSERLAAGVASWAAVAMDNAQLYEAERRARAEAESANRAKSDFLANMSHELRTPLNAIAGYADLLTAGVRGPISDSQTADIERIKQAGRHLLSLINDILNFAKIEAGHVHIVPENISLHEALANLETLVAPQLHERKLSYVYHPCDASLTAYADPERLQQVLLNLLSNAVKFTPPGGEISVDCVSDSETVAVRVTDTGPGIKAEEMTSIFEPFVQLNRTHSANNGGTGLGLAISRDLARAMGGDITVESRLGSGSAFTVSLRRHG